MATAAPTPTKKAATVEAAAPAAAPAPVAAAPAPAAAPAVSAPTTVVSVVDAPVTTVIEADQSADPSPGDGIDWPVSVELLNESGFPLSLKSGLFVSPAGSAHIALHDADHAKRIHAEVRSAAFTAYISDQVHLVGFPNIPE